jgi:hypothetical protein
MCKYCVSSSCLGDNMTQHTQTYLQNSALFLCSICKEFEDIIVRALTVPRSTEELVEMGRYMLYANTTFMEKMKGELAVMIQQLVQLMDMQSLSQEHIDLNTKTVLWLRNMTPVLKQNLLVSLIKHCYIALCCNGGLGWCSG